VAEPAYAKLFRNGRSQAVRLPREFRLPGERVRVSRALGGGVLLEPVIDDIDAWFKAMDEVPGDPADFLADVDFDQPITPEGREIDFE
jgi:antitoxin VapB